jgi:hypothetical protein
MHALVVTYGLAKGATPAELAELCEELEPAFAAAPGLVSKLWLTNPVTARHGGFYLFEGKPAFDRFVASELFGVLRSHPSLVNLTAADFSVNGTPAAATT